MSPDRRARPKRSWLTVFGLASLAILTVLLTLSSAVLAYAAWRIGQIDRLEVAGVLSDAPDDPVTASDVISAVGGGTAGTASTGANSSDGADPSDADAGSSASDNTPDSASLVGLGRFASLTSSAGDENYLLVGTDSIEGFDPDDPVALLRSANSHLADVIIVVRLREDGTAALLSIPRDLLVTIAGTSRVGKINSAYNIDPTPDLRAARLIDTIENELDITLQHYVEVDLDGFRQLIDAVGGVNVYFEKPLRDRSAGNYDDLVPDSSEFTTDAGWQLLDGDRALAYVRSRHLYEQNPDGTWQRKGVWNDLERNERQRKFLLDAIEQVSKELLPNPIALQVGLSVAANALATSDTLNVVTDGLRLANQVYDFDFENDIEEHVLSVKDVVEPGRWSLALNDILSATQHNQRVLDVFRGIGWDDVVESRVTVMVSGDDRWSVSDELSGLGFSASTTGENPLAAVVSAGADQQTTLAYGANGRLAAALLLSHLSTDVVLVGDPSLPQNTLALHVLAADKLPEISVDYRFVDLPPAP